MNNKLSELKAIAEKAKELGGINNYAKGKAAVLAFQAAANPSVVLALLAELEASKKSNAFLKEQLSKLANFNPDWDMLEACRDSWREVAAALKEAEANLEAKDKRIAELEQDELAMRASSRAVHEAQENHINQQQDRIGSLEKKNGDLGRALGAAEKRLATPVRLPDELARIGENLHTQDNRITSEPMFCVYQKREIVADAEYDHDRIVWVDEDGLEANERQRMRLELLHNNCREAPAKWRRVAVKEIDEFVTCCFTEQGCKDYLACNGHNLRLPFVYVKSGFRNAEYIALRKWLMTFTVEGGVSRWQV